MNYFDQLADRQLNGAQKAKERSKVRVEKRREEKMREPSPLELKQQEDAILAKMYRAWKREIRQELVQAHGRDFADLMRLLRNLSWPSAQGVLDYLEGAMWLRRADMNTRFATLGYITSSFLRARVRHGLPPFDDGMWDDPPSIEMQAKRLLGVD